MPVLPLGLASVAAAAQAAGHEVRVVDLLGQEDARTVLREAIQGFDPDRRGF